MLTNTTSTTYTPLPNKEAILERLFNQKHISFQELLVLLRDNYISSQFGVTYTGVPINCNNTPPTSMTHAFPENITYTHGK